MVDRPNHQPESEWRGRVERKLDALCKAIGEIKRDIVGDDMESAGRCIVTRLGHLESHRERTDRGTGRWTRIADTVITQLMITAVTAVIATVIFTRALPPDAAARIHALDKPATKESKDETPTPPARSGGPARQRPPT